jgi:toxin ParE1/3/4
MSRYVLTRRAEADIIDILTYSIESFGQRKALDYQSSLENCFELLAENPLMGRAAPQIDSKVRRHEHGSHIILYEHADVGVIILALVHKRNVRKLRI